LPQAFKTGKEIVPVQVLIGLKCVATDALSWYSEEEGSEREKIITWSHNPPLHF